MDTKRLLFAFILIHFIISCEHTPEEIAVSAVAITQPTAEMIIGETVQLQVSITPSNATDKTTLWSSSKQSVATVNNDGLVTAIAAGNTTITAAAGGKFGTCLVTVSKGFVAVTSVSLNTAKITLVEEETTTLTATVLPEDATDKSVVWTSSAGDVATVKDGLVTALKAGTCTITAKAGEKTAQCTVEVKPKVIVVTEVSLNKSKLSLVEGDSETLVATVKPDNATDKSVSWSSSNDAIATVTSSGKVTAVMEGTAVITASAGDKQAMCVVEVSKNVIPVSLISLNKSSLTLEKGKAETLVATVNPTNATDKTVTWSSSNPQVASVDQNGLVMAVNSGSSIITAKAGDKTATCAVTVNVPVENVSLSQSSVTLEEGQTTTLTATVYPSDATDKTITWSSSNTSVATVSNGKVTAIKEGSVTISAKAGNITATCSVTVTKKYIAVTSVTLNKTSLPLTKGASETLTATVKPDNATDKTVTWSSSNVAVASVDQNGKVYAVGGGNAVITAKAGDKTATCSVTVTVPVETVSLSQTTLELVEEQSTTLTATVYPSDATDKTVTWSSSNTSVATVSNGKVTAIKEGSVTISAKAGNITATCSVTVTKKYIAVTSVTLNKTTLSLTKGASETLMATVKPDDATDKIVTWSCTDVSVANVDQDGNVYAVGGGTSIITAKAGDKSATCSVTVTVPVELITMSQSSLKLTVAQSSNLTATVYPSDATDKTVVWSSSNTSVATVTDGRVTAISAGDAIITAEAGGMKAICYVTVMIPPSYSDYLGEWMFGDEQITITAKEEGSTYTVTGFVLLDALIGDINELTANYDSNSGQIYLEEQKLGSFDTADYKSLFGDNQYGICDEILSGLFYYQGEEYAAYPFNTSNPSRLFTGFLNEMGEIDLSAGSCQYGQFVGFDALWIIRNGSLAGRGNNWESRTYLPSVITPTKPGSEAYNAWLGKWVIPCTEFQYDANNQYLGQKDGESIWTIRQKIADASYFIKGIGPTNYRYAVIAKFNASDGSMIVTPQIVKEWDYEGQHVRECLVGLLPSNGRTWSDEFILFTATLSGDTATLTPGEAEGHTFMYFQFVRDIGNDSDSGTGYGGYYALPNTLTRVDASSSVAHIRTRSVSGPQPGSLSISFSRFNRIVK